MSVLYFICLFVHINIELFVVKALSFHAEFNKKKLLDKISFIRFRQRGKSNIILINNIIKS